MPFILTEDALPACDDDGFLLKLWSALNCKFIMVLYCLDFRVICLSMITYCRWQRSELRWRMRDSQLHASSPAADDRRLGHSERRNRSVEIPDMTA